VRDVHTYLRPRLIACAIVAIFGAAGTCLRVGVDRVVPQGADAWPWPTFLVNVAGAALAGYVVTHVIERLHERSRLRLALGTGFFGGLTTFSALQVDAVRLAHGGHPLEAVTYLLATLVCGIGAATITTRAARQGWSPA
jgi:fluoride exporter